MAPIKKKPTLTSAATRRVAGSLKSSDLKHLSPLSLGQHCPRQYPGEPWPKDGHPPAVLVGSRLGVPLNIRQVAELIGCSPWTVRQKLIPNGLPHFRLTASSKLIFYTDQVVAWIENKQKGGKRS